MTRSGGKSMASPPTPTRESVEAAIVARNQWRAANVLGLAATSETGSMMRAAAPRDSGVSIGKASVPLSNESPRVADSVGGPDRQERFDLGSTPLEGDWPLPCSAPAKKGVQRRLTLAPVIPESNLHGGSTFNEGGKQLARIQLAEDIHQHLFSSEADTSLADLDEACSHLEASMGECDMGGRWMTTEPQLIPVLTIPGYLVGLTLG